MGNLHDPQAMVIKKVIDGMVGTLQVVRHVATKENIFNLFNIGYSLLAFVGTHLLKEPFGSGSCSLMICCRFWFHRHMLGHTKTVKLTLPHSHDTLP